MIPVKKHTYFTKEK